MANPPTVPATASVPARSAALGRLHARRRPWWILFVVLVVVVAAGAAATPGAGARAPRTPRVF